MKTSLKQILVPTLSAVAGGLIVLMGLKINTFMESKRPIAAVPNFHRTFPAVFNEDLFGSDFFAGESPLDQFRKLRLQMDASLGQDFFMKEDSEFVYYEIAIPSLDTTSINTKVENGYVTISGTAEKEDGAFKDHDENSAFARSFYKSSFNRTFPLPDQVDANRMQMIPDKDKIILKFPKMNT